MPKWIVKNYVQRSGFSINVLQSTKESRINFSANYGFRSEVSNESQEASMETNDSDEINVDLSPKNEIEVIDSG